MVRKGGPPEPPKVPNTTAAPAHPKNKLERHWNNDVYVPPPAQRKSPAFAGLFQVAGGRYGPISDRPITIETTVEPGF